MKRSIVDYAKLTPEVLELLVQKFPDGYGSDDIISFKNASGETVKAVEVRSEDTVYLVKISLKLEQRMEDFDQDDFDNDDTGGDADDFDFDQDDSVFSDELEEA